MINIEERSEEIEERVVMDKEIEEGVVIDIEEKSEKIEERVVMEIGK